MAEDKKPTGEKTVAGLSLQIILEASPVGIAVFDKDARVLYANDLAERLFDRKVDASGPIRCGDFIGCAKRNSHSKGCGHTRHCPACPLFSAICSVCSSESDSGFDEGEAFLERESDLAGLWVKFRIVPAMIDGRKVAVMAVEDITLAKRNQEKLQAVLTELSIIHEHAPVAMMLVDSDRIVHKANGFAARFAERTTAEMIGMRGGEALRCLHHLDDPQGCGFGPACAECRVRKAVLETFEKGVGQEGVEAWLPFPRGESTEEGCLLISTAFLKIDGTERVLLCAQDITDRKRAENALQQSERQYRSLFNSIRDAILVADTNRNIIEYNSGFVDLFGYSHREIIGKKTWVIYHGKKEFDRMDDAIREHMDEPSFLHTIQYQKKDGSVFPGETSVFYQRDNEGKIAGFIGLIRDISDRIQAQEAQKALEVQLSQAQKMEAVGRLAGGVAHDFNNMLNIILGYAEMAIDDLAPNSPILTALEEIQKAAERSANLTRQLLAFARKQTVAPRVLDLNETIASMLKLLQRLIGENIDMAWIPCEAVWPVKIDPAQIDQILANLCVNARDAIAGVGKMTIETSNIVFDENYCKLHTGFVLGEYAMLAVSDNGCGMDTKTMANLFEPFYTTKELGKGTGLGLATVYGVVKQNNGFINVYSEPGQGTTFKIYLPRYLSKTVSLPEKGTDQPSKRGHETILLVEDEPAIRRMATIMLVRKGYTVVSAGTPGEAIRLATEHAGEIHLLMTDVVMPEMNGRDLSKNILSLYPQLKCLFMSGYTANVIAHHGVLDEGVNFIQKPFSKEDLAVKVREALER